MVRIFSLSCPSDVTNSGVPYLSARVVQSSPSITMAVIAYVKKSSFPVCQLSKKDPSQSPGPTGMDR